MILCSEHIDELRAEPRGCLDPWERAQITAELEAAIAALKEAAKTALMTHSRPWRPAYQPVDSGPFRSSSIQ
jgi:hypothetical protein